MVAGVDMEDLGVRSCSTAFQNSSVEQVEFPEDLKQYVKVTPCHNGSDRLPVICLLVFLDLEICALFRVLTS